MNNRDKEELIMNLFFIEALKETEIASILKMDCDEVLRVIRNVRVYYSQLMQMQLDTVDYYIQKICQIKQKRVRFNGIKEKYMFDRIMERIQGL